METENNAAKNLTTEMVDSYNKNLNSFLISNLSNLPIYRASQGD